MHSSSSPNPPSLVFSHHLFICLAFVSYNHQLLPSTWRTVLALLSTLLADLQSPFPVLLLFCQYFLTQGIVLLRPGVLEARLVYLLLQLFLLSISLVVLVYLYY